MPNKELRLVWFASDQYSAPPTLLESLAKDFGWAVRTVNTWEETNTTKSDPNSVIFTTEQNLSLQHGKRMLSRDFASAVVLYKDGDGAVPRIMRPQGIVTPSDTLESVKKTVYEAIEAKRRESRLSALREHHRVARSFDGSPALSLIIDIVKSCTASESYEDILAATRAMSPTLNFSEGSLILIGVNSNSSTMFNFSFEKKSTKIESSKIDFPADALDLSFDEPMTQFIRPDSHFGQQISTVRKQPWGSAIAMGFRAQATEGLSALLILFRKDLFPFTEKDAWVLELGYYPLSLALEKVAILDRLHRASAQWRSTFDGISEAVTVVNDNFEIIKANHAFAALVDHSIKNLKGRRCYSLLAGRRSPCKGCPIVEKNSGGAGTSISGKQGSILAWSYGLDLGNEEYHFQFYRNTTTEVLLASRLIQAEKLAALGKIFSAIAHELNNPIGGILATSQILLRESRRIEDIREIHDAAVRSKKIIDTLLGFTSGSYRGTESAPLRDSINSTLMLVKSGLRKIKLKKNIKNENARVENSSALQQILFNLITNAIHALNGVGAISLATEKRDSWIKITVADDGPGIPNEKLKNIFDPFITTKEEGKGTGLGLAIVRTLVERIGGTIDVASKKGAGTTFTILIPEARDDGPHTHSVS